MNKTIRGGARNIVYRVFLQCLAEFQAGTLLRNLEDIYQRTADYTGVSESTVRRIALLGSQNEGKFSTPAKHRKGRRKIFFFYSVKKEIPTVGKLLAQLRQDIGYDGSREHLRRLLLNMGFSFKKCKTNRHALIEKSNIAHKRECYLHEIMKNRDLPEELQKDFIYLDESYIHSSYKVKKCWQSIETAGILTDISKGKRWILIHAGSEKGFVPNALVVFSGVNKQEDYHSEMNQKNFTKWVTEKLIPNITEPSIINKAPTSAKRVSELREWLIENNISFDPHLRKPSLLALVRKHKPEPQYEIDEIFGEFGHTVVRLPPYHCDLNPIELIWANAKQKITMEAFDSITVQDWKNACEHIKKIEKEYYDRGRTLYDDIDQLVIQLGDDSSSSEDEYEHTNEKMLDDINVGASSSSDINVGASTSSQIEDLDFDLLD
ncbi:hypothetical protein ABMA27_013600 [Loxostege sticticalis]|uniref:HeH/LEM domain-containing protein n=1 Tax=Loxostege sticticalis TaxID=481309 RepID=A0ABR3IFX5_LOXSC